MSCIGVVYNKASGTIIGYFSVGNNADLHLNFDPETQGLIELPLDHPALYEQEKWEIFEDALRRKPDA